MASATGIAILHASFALDSTTGTLCTRVSGCPGFLLGVGVVVALSPA